MEGSIAVLLGFALRVSPFGTTAPAPEHILLGVACVLPLLLAGELLVLDRLAGFVCCAGSHALFTGCVWHNVPCPPGWCPHPCQPQPSAASACSDRPQL